MYAEQQIKLIFLIAGELKRDNAYISDIFDDEEKPVSVASAQLWLVTDRYVSWQVCCITMHLGKMTKVSFSIWKHNHQKEIKSANFKKKKIV